MPKMLRWILSGFFLIVIGTTLLLVGKANHGQNRIIWRNGHFEVPRVKNVALDHHIKAFNELQLDVSGAAVTVQPGDKFDLSGSVDDTDGLKVTQKAGKLTIHYNGNWSDNNTFGVGFAAYKPQKLVITVPRDVNLKTVAGTVSANHVNVHDLTVDTVNLTMTDGDIALKAATAKTLNLTTSDGDVNLTDVTADNTTVTTQSGDLYTKGALGHATLNLTDGDWNGRDTTLSNAVIRSSDSDTVLSQTTWQGVNSLTIQDGDFRASNNQTDGYHVQVTDGDLVVKGTRYTDNYNDNDTATDRVAVAVTDGDVAIN